MNFGLLFQGKLLDKLKAITADNVRKMYSDMTKLSDLTNKRNNLSRLVVDAHIRCIPHADNLGISDLVKQVHAKLHQIRSFLSALRCSAMRWEALTIYGKHLGLTAGLTYLDVPMLWTATFSFISSAYKVHPVLISITPNVLEQKWFTISDRSWENAIKTLWFLAIICIAYRLQNWLIIFYPQYFRKRI